VGCGRGVSKSCEKSRSLLAVKDGSERTKGGHTRAKMLGDFCHVWESNQLLMLRSWNEYD
jgi:hypothetical protein